MIKLITTVLLIMFLTTNLFAKIILVSATGEVAYKDEKTTKWMPLPPTPGTELQNGLKISTGLKSSVTLNLSGNKVTIGPLSVMKVYENQLVDGAQQTKIGMRRGQMTADVTRGEKVKTVFKVATPVATSSVRGTEKTITTGPSGTIVAVPKGSAKVDSKNGQARVISGRLAFNLPKGAIEPRPILTNSNVSLVNSGHTEKEQMAAEIFTDAPQGTDVPLVDNIVEDRTEVIINK